jgi:hypothetical protein
MESPERNFQQQVGIHPAMGRLDCDRSPEEIHIAKNSKWWHLQKTSLRKDAQLAGTPTWTAMRATSAIESVALLYGVVSVQLTARFRRAQFDLR